MLEINISIIIPTYNMEKYLDECMQSICSQYCDNIQIICIDDCSTDKSNAILNRWKKSYPKIEIYVNDKNYGLAYTRNVGLKHARGEYVMFIDPDDYIEQGLERIYVKAKQEEADVLLFSTKMFAEEGFQGTFDADMRVKKEPYRTKAGIHILTELIQRQEMYSAVWSAIYRLNYLQENDIKFISGILHEDIPFYFKALLYAEKVCGITDVIYNYRQRNGSILHDMQYVERFEGAYVGYIDMLNNWFQYTISRDIDRETIEVIHTYLKKIEKTTYTKHEIAIRHNEKIESAIHFWLEDDEYKGNIANMLKQRKVAIYGAGMKAEEWIRFLQEKEVFVEHVFVTSKEKNPEYIEKIPVEIFSAGKVEEDEIILVTVKKNGEIIDNFKKNGIYNYICL